MHLQVEQLTKSFFKNTAELKALDEVSWEIAGGSVLAIIGPNGSGKSTMLRILLGLLPQSSGTVRVDGEIQYSTSRTFLPRLGFLPEERGLYPRERVLPMLTYLGELKGMSTAAARSSATLLLERFQLREWSSERIDKLSKGMAQRVQIIGALVHNPDLVIFDEPFYGLDPLGMHEIRELIRELANAGKLILISTHAMNEAQILSDSVLMLNKGRRVLFGATNEIRRSRGASHIALDTSTSIDGIACIESEKKHKDERLISLKPNATMHELLQELLRLGRAPSRLEVRLPTLDEIFINEITVRDGTNDQ